MVGKSGLDRVVELIIGERALGDRDRVDVLQALGVRGAPVEDEHQGVAGRDAVAIPGGRFAHLEGVGLVAGDRGAGAHLEEMAAEGVTLGADALQQTGLDRFVEAVQPEEATGLTVAELVGEEGVDGGGHNSLNHRLRLR